MTLEKVCLELTSKCNLNCTMCYRKAWPEGAEDMDRHTLDHIINQIRDTESIKEIVLGGIGEPTIHPAIELAMVALKDYHLTLTSNGKTWTDSMIETMVNTLDQVVVSTDGLDSVFFDIRGFEFSEVVENLVRFNRAKKNSKRSSPSLIFQMVITTVNKDQVFKLIDLASSLDVNQIILSNILPATLEDASLTLYSIQANEEIKDFYRKVRNYAMRRGLEVKMLENQLKTERRCRFIENNTAVIVSNGNVVPCYRFAHDGTEVVFGRLKTIEAHSFGNVNELHLNEIWNSNSYKNYRLIVLNNLYPSCMDCDLVDGCDMVNNTESDCYGNLPSCADCLWSRNLIYCI